MNYAIERGSRVPAYFQLYRQIRENILSGAYPFRGRLPSKRVMAAETGVSTITVEHAYEQLCAEGYIESRERSGYFVIFRPTDGFASASDREASSAALTRQGPPAEEGFVPFPFSVLAKTMRRVLDDRGEDILKKSSNTGCAECREAVAKYLARNRGIRVGAEQIVIGSGAEYLYGLIVELLGRDKVYALEFPSYEKIEQVYRASGVRCRLLPLGPEGIESGALAQACADVLHVTPYRSYPTGITASASKRHEYLRWAAAGDRFIVEDDFESEFSVTGRPVETLFALAGQDNVIYVNTFSKTISPAVRVGYMVLPKRLVAPFCEKLGFYSCSVPAFEQYVLAELIERGDFERHINRVRRSLRRALPKGGA